MFTLKNYQSRTLAVLKSYLETARLMGAQPAFESVEKSGVREARRYQPLPGLETVPYVCLRLPTGGGKTLLSANTVKIAADEYLEREFPVVLWLVPSNPIRTQTLETLQKPGHPNHEALQAAFDGRFRVVDITDFTLLTPADFQTGAVIVVGTMQTLRVNSTDGRKVYAHNEHLEPHFTSVSPNTPNMERKEGDSTIKFSFRNVLALHRPLVIVDEAHNNTSKLSYEVLQRVNAACVIEFTATPARDSNILHNVSASELKAEEMIKLPIRLTEHTTWGDAVRDSILERQRLHDLAMQEKDYLRPIVLFQAEDKGGDVTKEILVQHLVESERIPREKIAVVTGEQKELDGINLFSPTCPIDYVVTVEALKEGWDCSFAYVFCSVANVHSRKDVEQILGRVLRMPYARRRASDDLNRAYAHVSRASWPNAVKQLHDKLVDMGFEETEADSFIEKGPELQLPGGSLSLTPAVPPAVLMLEEDISTFSLTPEEQQQVRIEKTPTGSRIIMTGNIEDATVQRLASALRSPENKAVLAIEARRHKAAWRQHLSPLQRGVSFRVPQLCLNLNGTLEPAESESLLGMRGWNLLDYPPDISEAEFRLTDTGVQWEIDIGRQGKLTERVVGETEQRNLDLIDTGWTEGHLCWWLERQVRQIDLKQTMLLEFVRRAVASLTDKRRLSLTSIVRYRFALAKVLQQKISQCRADASTKSYQQSLFDAEPAAVETSFSYVFDFGSAPYAPHWSYVGYPHVFQKHYYPNVGELKNSGEEYECAKALDMTRAVKHWVRNLERRGFSLPLALGKFYPDFVAELGDGRILVVEHKGQDRATADDAKEKKNIGELWEERSNGKALFLMTVVEKGRPGLYEQIAVKLEQSGPHEF